MLVPPFAAPSRSTASPRSPAPHPAISDRSTAGTQPDATAVTLEGSSGPAVLRRADGGHLEVWPRPTPDALRALYGGKFYEEDKSSYLDDVDRERPYWDAIWSIRRALLESALSGFAPRPWRLLDVGSSGGFLLDHFRGHGWQTFGIEPSGHAARYARERFGLEVFCGELLDFDLDTDRDWREAGGVAFDAIHCAQVLEHVLDPEACIARMAEWLAPRGVVFIEVPNDFNVLQQTARAKLGKPAWWVAPDHHLNYFDAESLSGLLARHGLVELDRIASFPIEMFLLMGEDYVGHPDVGRACHARRMAFERALLDAGRQAELADLYRALARAGIGRTIGILAGRAR